MREYVSQYKIKDNYQKLKFITEFNLSWLFHIEGICMDVQKH